MCKNAVIALLATALMFTNTVLAGYGVLAYLAVSVVVFAILCMIEDAYERHMNMVRRFKRFRNAVNKITLNAPTKAC